MWSVGSGSWVFPQPAAALSWPWRGPNVLSPRTSLVDSIRRNGLLQQIVLHQGKILAGCNRYRACKACRYRLSAKDFTELPPGKDPFEFVFAKNLARRHLDGEQKRKLVLRLIRERPNDNDRKIAALVGVSNKTVWTYRKELEEALEKLSWHQCSSGCWLRLPFYMPKLSAVGVGYLTNTTFAEPRRKISKIDRGPSRSWRKLRPCYLRQNSPKTLTLRGELTDFRW